MRPFPDRYPLLDGLRAFAATLVFTFHAWIFLRYTDLIEAVGSVGANGVRGLSSATLHLGEVGVALFYLLSAFLLYRPFARAALERAPTRAVIPYAIRRASRILPGYWAAVTLIGIIDPSTNAFSIHGLWSQYLFGSLYSSGGLISASNPYMATWTIAVEVSFYIFLPIWAGLLGLVRKVFDRPLAVEAVGVVFLICVGLVWKVVAAEQISGEAWFGSSFAVLPASIDVFAAGMGLAILSLRPDLRLWGLVTRIQRRPGTAWFAALILYGILCWAVDVRTPVTGSLAGQALISGFGKIPIALLLLIPALSKSPSGSLIQKALRARAVLWVGTVSYGLYLWHLFVLRHLSDSGSGGLFPPMDHRLVELFPLNATFAYLLSLLLGAISWYGIERWTLAYGHNLASRVAEKARFKQIA